MTILVTGGSGFIGTNFVKNHIKTFEERVVNIDKLTYASNSFNRDRLDKWFYVEEKLDIADDAVEKILEYYRPSSIINFAAESHVDNSIINKIPFIDTNIVGTTKLLEKTLAYFKKHKDHLKNLNFRFIHISTDEVYGSLSLLDVPSTEKSTYYPRSPYSASKAASDHLVNAFHHTYGLPTVVINCSNNYGPHQHAEKFIPTAIDEVLYKNLGPMHGIHRFPDSSKKGIPIYGTGKNIRDWLFVEDHIEALEKVLLLAPSGSKYNIGGNVQISNLELAKMILNLMGEDEGFIRYVKDRPGHDFRYDINCSKFMNEFGWKPKTSLEDGLRKTITWYKNEYTRNHSSSRQINSIISSYSSDIEAVTTNLRQAPRILPSDDVDVGRDKGRFDNSKSE